MNKTHSLALLALIFLAACQTSKEAPSTPSSTEPAPVRVATPGSGLNLAEMDLAADPSVDFYRYVNGGWLVANPVPSDESLWGVFNEVKKRNELVMKQTLEEAESKPTSELLRKLGDFYFTGMDVKAIEAQGAKPLDQSLATINGLEQQKQLPEILARLHTIGCAGMFGVSSGADLTDASMNILFIAQDGMGLPEKDYYLRDDSDSIALRKKYEAHIARMFALQGESQGEAEGHAVIVMAIEIALAKGSFGALDFRDPQNLLNKISVADAQALTPNFDWTAYLTALGLDPSQQVNLVAPGYFRALDQMLTSTPLDDWKTYLRWHLVSGNADYLSKAFEDENFAFFGRTLGGAKEQRPRWKRVLESTGRAMGEVLGQAFVAKTFSPQAKARCQKMVDDLIGAYRVRIEKLEWMGDETRAKALGKLAAFRTKIGYPDKWRDWSGLVVKRDSYAANYQRSREFAFHYDLGKVGKPVDKAEFGMPAYIVNAGYNPTNNDITFPAGILQPPFFSESYDDALNYGAMGAVIGHELTHGFDDEGSQFDAVGNLSNWWTPKDREEFERRAQVVVDQFSNYVAIDDLKVNGKLTLGENLADLGGVTIAYDALQKAQTNERLMMIDGFTPAQRFYIAWARAWRCNYTPERLKLQVNTNPHSPAMFRAIGPLSNLDDFQQAFGLADDAKVMRPKA